VTHRTKKITGFSLLPSSGAYQIIATLQKNNYLAYVCGGYVRDLLLEKEDDSKDIDITTSATPSQIKGLFPTAKFVGESFGVSLVKVEGVSYEVATFRKDIHSKEIGVTHGVELCLNAEEDVCRRDLTINGLLLDPIKGEVIDYVGGLDDLKMGVVHFIGDSEERIREDPIRMLRAIRFSCVNNFFIGIISKEAIVKNASLLKTIPYERIRQEFEKSFTIAPTETVEAYNYFGLLQLILPEVYNLQFVPQSPIHHPEGNVYNHTLLVLSELHKEGCRDFITLMAGLLHDIGKEPTTQIKVGQEGIYRIVSEAHDKEGVPLAEKVCERFKLSNYETEQIVGCVKDHMLFFHAKQMKTSTIKKKIAVSYFDRLLQIIKADSKGRGVDNRRDEEFLVFLEEKIGKVEAQNKLPKPLVDGKDLITLGLTEGKLIGIVKKALYNKQLENEEFRREDLLKEAVSFLEDYERKLIIYGDVYFEEETLKIIPNEEVLQVLN